MDTPRDIGEAARHLHALLDRHSPWAGREGTHPPARDDADLWSQALSRVAWLCGRAGSERDCAQAARRVLGPLHAEAQRARGVGVRP